MQQPAWRAEFRSLNRAPKAHFARRAEVCSAGEGGRGRTRRAALDLDSEKEPLGPWRDSDVRVGFFFVFSAQGRQVWAPSFFFSRSSASQNSNEPRGYDDQRAHDERQHAELHE